MVTWTETSSFESLTDRERQMAQAVSRGLRNRQIASEFGISEETVKNTWPPSTANCHSAGGCSLPST